MHRRRDPSRIIVVHILQNREMGGCPNHSSGVACGLARRLVHHQRAAEVPASIHVLRACDLGFAEFDGMVGVAPGDPPLSLAIGDERSGEDLFDVLPETAVTATVGTAGSRARHRLPDYQTVRELLRALIQHAR